MTATTTGQSPYYQTEHQKLVHQTHQKLFLFLEKKKKCRVFIDLHKAFDTVNHNILISKLEYHGICEIPLAWFKSSLRNRFQYISVNGTESELLLIKHAVSQGSISTIYTRQLLFRKYTTLLMTQTFCMKAPPGKTSVEKLIIICQE